MAWLLSDGRVWPYLIRINVLYELYTYIMEGKANENIGSSIYRSGPAFSEGAVS